MKTIETMRTAQPSEKILSLKNKMFEEKRFMSLEQAHIITESYKKNEALSTAKKRAHSLAAAMDLLHIAIDPEELIVANRTAGVRAGVVFPESGISWIDKEIETLHSRPQDKFNVHPEDISEFREFILPYWQGKSLEDTIRAEGAQLIDSIAKVVKINQKDHAQGHICPDTEKWIRLGAAGICKEAETYLKKEKDPAKIEFYECVIEVLNGSRRFIKRYADLAADMQKTAVEKDKANLAEIERICRKLASEAPECGARTFREALQALWFLYVLLQMESNASSFSPGRADQYLYPYYRSDIDNGTLNDESALELIEALWLKFNQIVYLRNSHSAAFFAGFPIGFNIALGGIKEDGSDASNELSYLFLKAQEHLGLPQPNLSARLHEKTPETLLNECAAVIGKGSGMPQVFNDESIVPALSAQGISEKDAKNYAIVGCVELTTHGNNLGWSDAAMFNLPKVLELALNDGVCLLTGQQLGPKTGTLEDFKTYEDVEKAFQTQIDYFFDKMISACELVEKIHQRLLPTAFLSSVIDDCLAKGIDVTAGGARYNLSGIQVIQPANIADSLAALKQLVYDEKKICQKELLQALRTNFQDAENLRTVLLNDAPKYGNDIEWVDNIANKWIVYFSDKFKELKNYRGGRYHTGMYTVSAHVPMGANVGASCDGRLAGTPLADGGQSAVYGRDINGPTAVLKSVSRIDPSRGSNGTLLNMKFLPQFFKTQEGIRKFSSFLRGFVRLKINHAQFNVVRKEDLLAAQKNPEAYRSLTIRVAGYTAYFTELAADLQNEIIARTSYDDI